jgi:tetratricopeptide (TPR) repeat protein
MDHKKRLAEIKEIIWGNWSSNVIDDNFFLNIESELQDIHTAAKENDCLWLISELHHLRSVQSKKKAAHYALKALERDYDHKGAHQNLEYGNNVRFSSFDHANHNEIIEFYFQFINNHPDCLIAHRILLQCLMDNYRFEEAVSIIDIARARFHTKPFLWDLYYGEILFKSGKQADAQELWEQACAGNQDDYLCFLMVADYYANFHFYDNAVTKFTHAFELQKPPRKIDSLIGIYKIYEIQKEYGNALASIDTIIEVFKTDYNTENGPDIEELVDEKTRIMGKMDTLAQKSNP